MYLNVHNLDKYIDVSKCTQPRQIYIYISKGTQSRQIYRYI